MMRSGATIGSTDDSGTAKRKHHTMNTPIMMMPTDSTAGEVMSPNLSALRIC